MNACCELNPNYVYSNQINGSLNLLNGLSNVCVDTRSIHVEPELSFDFAGKTYHDRALYEFIQKHSETNESEKRKDDQSMTKPELAAAAMQKIARMMPKPTRIEQFHHKGNIATIVHWDDGTYTAVNCKAVTTEGENIYAAYAAALCKKIYGSTSAVHKLVDRNSAETIDRREKEERDRKIAEQKAAEQRNHDREVRRLAKQMILESEAREIAFKETFKEIIE